jgi:hypothetical protein
MVEYPAWTLTKLLNDRQVVRFKPPTWEIIAWYLNIQGSILAIVVTKGRPSPRGAPGVPGGCWGGAPANHDFKIQTCCMEFQIPKLSNHIGKCSMCDFYHRNSYPIYLRFVSETIKNLRILETMRLLIGRDSGVKTSSYMLN